jgi:hypothetical protein
MRKLRHGGDLSPVSVSIGKILIGRDFCHRLDPGWVILWETVDAGALLAQILPAAPG